MLGITPWTNNNFPDQNPQIWPQVYSHRRLRQALFFTFSYLDTKILRRAINARADWRCLDLVGANAEGVLIDLLVEFKLRELDCPFGQEGSIHGVH